MFDLNRSKFQSSVLSVMSDTLSSTSAMSGDDYADNNTTAGVLPGDGMIVTGNLEVQGDRDWFAITVEAGETWRFNLDAVDQGFDASLFLLTADGSQLAYNDDANGSLNSEISYTFSSAGTYYLSAGALSGYGTGGYDISATLTTDDYADNAGTTGSIRINSTTTGTMDYSGDNDWFAVTLSETDLLRFRMDGYFNLNLYNEAGGQVAYGNYRNGVSELIVNDQAAGQYYVSVSRYSSTVEDYTLALYRLTDDFTDDVSTTGALAIGGAVTGRANFTGDNDWIAIELEAGTTVELTHSGRGQINNLRTESGDYAPLIAGQYQNNAQIYFAQVSETGTYFLEVNGYELGQYNISAALIEDDFPADLSTSASIDLTAGGESPTLTVSGDFPSDSDWVILDVPTQSIVSLTISTTQVNAGVRTLQNGYVYDVGQQYDYDAGTLTVTFQTGELSQYVLDLSSYNVMGEYTVTGSLLVDDYGQTVDDAGVVILDGAAVTGTHEYRNDNDWFAIELDAGDIIRATALQDQYNNYSEIRVRDQDGLWVISTSFYDNGVRGAYAVAETAGTYYIDVSSYTPSNYSLEVTSVSDDIGNTQEDAVVVPFGETLTVSQDYTGDFDWIAVELAAGETALVQADSPYYLNMTVSGPEEYSAYGSSQVGINAPVSGTYYIELNAPAANGNYNYSISVDLIEDDLADNNSTTGVIIPDGPTTRSQRDFEGDVDWFAFQAEADSVLRFYTNGYHSIYIVSEDGEYTYLREANWLNTDFSYFAEFDDAGTYYFIISPDYSEEYYIRAITIDDDYTGLTNTAGVLTTDGTDLTGRVDFTEDEDWFAVELTQGDILDVSVISSVSSGTLRIYDGNGNYVSDSFGSDSNPLSFTASESGTYYLGYQGGYSVVVGEYTLTASVTPDESSITINGTESGETLTGTSVRNIINGFGGNDFLRGLSGDDDLSGGAGVDWLRGGPGADTIDGGDGVDWADYSTSTAAVIVNLDSGDNFGGHAEGDTILSIERVFGSRFDDDITGDSANNYLRGYSGDDLLIGGAGNDILQGDAGADTLVGGGGTDTAYYVSALAGITVNLDDHNQNSGEAYDDLLIEIENITGSRFDDIITGDIGDNYLRGYLGDDILAGGAGHDTLRGDAGTDIFVFKTGTQSDLVIDYNDTEDMLDFSAFGFTDVNNALSNAADVNGDVVFTIGSDIITIENTTIIEITDNIIV